MTEFQPIPNDNVLVDLFDLKADKNGYRNRLHFYTIVKT